MPAFTGLPSRPTEPVAPEPPGSAVEDQRDRASFTNSTRMSAPNTPVSTATPSRVRCAQNAATSGSATGREAAALHDGRRPFRVSAYNVNWLTTSTPAPAHRPPTLLAQDPQRVHLAGQARGVLGGVGMRDAEQHQRPVPIWPTTCSSTCTDAVSTRWTTARWR